MKMKTNMFKMVFYVNICRDFMGYLDVLASQHLIYV